MNTTQKKITILCCLFSFWAFTPGGRLCHAHAASLEPLWNTYAPKTVPVKKGNSLHNAWELFMKRLPEPSPASYPGKTVGDDVALSSFMKLSDWRYRTVSYELYFAFSRELARSVYGLAIQNGDVDPTMPLERFEKGVRGFHYTIRQVCLWIDAVLAGDIALQTGEEQQLLLWLLKDGVVDLRDGKAIPAGRIHHVLGAAPGGKRTFETTLRHERLHVLWDEDPVFADTFRKKWQALSESEKQAARKRLAAYAQGNETQLIEEWAVFLAEDMPERERKSLVGL